MRVQTMRSVIRLAEPVHYLIPQDCPLFIVARIDLIHIDQIIMGQKVNLRFSALYQRTTPEFLGHVTLISADVFGVTYYRVEIALDLVEV